MHKHEIREIIDEKIDWDMREEGERQYDKMKEEIKIVEPSRESLIQYAQTEKNLAIVRSYDTQDKFEINRLWLEFIKKDKISVKEMWELLAMFNKINFKDA